jgi:PAS domain S-box-containing protein
MDYTLSELIEINELQSLCELFTQLTGYATAILDMEGTVLTATGWQDVCTCFHRRHPATAARCMESDVYLAAQLRRGEKYTLYRCRNGLLDAAVPLFIAEKQVGNLYSGQFLFEPPDVAFFRQQAAEFGFDETSYLEAVGKAPVVTEERVRQVMEFLSRLADIIGRIGLASKDARRANLVVENSPVVLFRWTAAEGWPVEFVTRNVIQFGYTPEELLSGDVPFTTLIHPDDLERVVCEARDHSTRGDDQFPREYRIITKAGNVRWIDDRTVIERDASGHITHYQGIVVDITERKLAEEQVRASLAEKTILLKEVHHRVKNNLQIVSSLLDLQADSLRDEQSRIVFRDIQSRISSMALVHEKLYQSERVAFINFADYIDSLVQYLFSVFVKDPELITLNLDISDCTLGIDEAISCGLIINELISNSIKYAFPENRSGEIAVRCRTEGGGWIVITVADNGDGLPGDLDFKNPTTLGLQLVSMLVQQLRGELTLEVGNGTAFTIRFRGRGE